MVRPRTPPDFPLPDLPNSHTASRFATEEDEDGRSMTPFTLGSNLERSIAGAKRRLGKMEAGLQSARSSLVSSKPRVVSAPPSYTPLRPSNDSPSPTLNGGSRGITVDEMRMLRDDLRSLREKFEARRLHARVRSPMVEGYTGHLLAQRQSLQTKLSTDSVLSYRTAKDDMVPYTREEQEEQADAHDDGYHSQSETPLQGIKQENRPIMEQVVTQVGRLAVELDNGSLQAKQKLEQILEFLSL